MSLLSCRLTAPEHPRRKIPFMLLAALQPLLADPLPAVVRSEFIYDTGGP